MSSENLHHRILVQLMFQVIGVTVTLQTWAPTRCPRRTCRMPPKPLPCTSGVFAEIFLADGKWRMLGWEDYQRMSNWTVPWMDQWWSDSHGLFQLLVNGIYWDYNPLTNLLLTCWGEVTHWSDHFWSIHFRPGHPSTCKLVVVMQSLLLAWKS